MNIFFCNQISNNQAVLDKVESGHAIRVLRMKSGDTVHFIDGKGSFYEGVILDPNPKSVTIQITSVQAENDRPYYLHLAVAPTKNTDRFEWMLEKSTELGIDRITPLSCARSERKTLRHDRSMKVILSAVKQSLKARLPLLDEMTPFDHLIRQEFSGEKLIAHCLDKPKTSVSDWIRTGNRFLILIGPEGDFSQEEISQATAQGFKGISLGNSRLRTETAALVACGAIYLYVI